MLLATRTPYQGGAQGAYIRNDADEESSAHRISMRVRMVAARVGRRRSGAWGLETAGPIRLERRQPGDVIDGGVCR